MIRAKELLGYSLGIPSCVGGHPSDHQYARNYERDTTMTYRIMWKLKNGEISALAEGGDLGATREYLAQFRLRSKLRYPSAKFWISHIDDDGFEVATTDHEVKKSRKPANGSPGPKSLSSLFKF